MDGMGDDRTASAGQAWEDALDGFHGGAHGRTVIGRARTLARDGGRLAMAMDVIAGAVRGLDRSRGPDGWAYMMLADAPVSMAGNGAVPDGVPRIITMVAFSSMAMCVAGSSAQYPTAYCILPSGIGRRWGYDGPDVTPGFIRSMIADGWIRRMTESERFEHPLPACMVELVASMTGGVAPDACDIARAYRMQTGSDLARDRGVHPEVPLPMDAATLGMTDGLRDRMGAAWPVVPNLLWGDGPSHLSMGSVRFVIMTMDWKRPASEDGVGAVFNGFLDAFSNGDGTIDDGMLSGRLLLSWAASTHDQRMMAAAVTAAPVADRLSMLACRSAMHVLDAGMLRDLATMPDMPDGFLMETMKAAAGTP